MTDEKKGKKDTPMTATAASELSLEELRELAREAEIEGYESMTRPQLIIALQGVGVILPN